MPDDLVFMMGKYEAHIPVDRLYADNHLWLQPLEDASKIYRVGFTTYSVRLLQDVYFLEWLIEENSLIKNRQEVGEIESSKALSALYAPSDGTLLKFNEELLEDPTAINTDCYNNGWLFTFEISPETTTTFHDAEAYFKILDEGWDETQRHLKGQMN